MSTDGHECVAPGCALRPETCRLEQAMHRQIYLFSVAFLTALAPVFATLTWLASSSQTLPIVLSIYALLPANAFLTIRHRNYLVGLKWLHGVNFAIILTAAVLQPGIGTPQMWWLASMPFVCLLSGLLRLGVVLECVVVAYVGWAYFRGAAPPDLSQAIVFRTHLAVALTTIYVCGHLSFAMRWRDKLQEALEKANALASASADAKARFLASVSHEIRTPLNGVIGAAELMRRPHLPTEQREQLASLQEQSAKTLLALINNILDWSKLEADKVVLDLQPIYLRRLVFELNELFSIPAFAKDIEFTSSCSPDVPRLVQADPTRIRQVVSNLVGNAVKFTNSGGVHIHVDVEQAAATDVHSENMTIRIEVSDSGVGIAKEQLTHLFSAFHQAAPSITRDFGGTGLGLAISKQLVSLMGGEIRVMSVPNHGSKFTVVLPLKMLPKVPGALRKSTPGRVLLATASEGLIRHVTPLLEELKVAHQTMTELPAMYDVAVSSHLVMDAALTEGIPDFRAWLDEASQHAQVALLVPIGSDSVQGAIPNVALLYKPLRRSALATFVGAEDTVPATATSTPSCTKLRILVCEDNTVNQVVVQAMLAELGVSYALAKDGIEALEHLREERFDLVLMDCQMPRMDGTAATREWRLVEAATGNRTPIIAMTANCDSEEFHVCRAAGMDGLLAKPFGILSLQKCIENWTSQKSVPAL